MTAPIVVTLAPTRPVEVVLFVAADSTLDLGTPAQVAAIVLDDIFRGPQGNPGPSGSIALEIVQGAFDGINTITVPVPFSFSRLYINGLRQRTDSYTVAGNVVTLPTSLNCVAGDLLVFEYLPT